MEKEKQRRNPAAKPGIRGTRVWQKAFAGVMMLALMLSMLSLPVFTETVKAEEEIQVTIWYEYMNADGGISHYTDYQSVTSGTTWQEFFDSYEKCYESGTIADANAENIWEGYFQDKSDTMDSEFIYSYNYYCFSGCPSAYRIEAYGANVYKNDECVASFKGERVIVPSSYTPGGDEACAYVGEYVKQLYFDSDDVVTVTVEADHYYDDGRTDGYWVYWVEISGETSDDSGTSEDSETYSSVSAATADGRSLTLYQETGCAWDMTDAQNSTLDALYSRIDENASDEEKEAVYISFINELTGIEAVSLPVYCMTYLGIDETQVTGEELAAGITATFSAPSISSGDRIVVLHLKADGTWEQINASAGNGTITGVFYSFSPVFYAKYTTAGDTDHYHNYTAYVTEPTVSTWGYTTYICECGDTYYDNYVAPTGTSGSAEGVTSPKTGESSAPYVTAGLALAATAGIAVRSRRRRAEIS